MQNGHIDGGFANPVFEAQTSFRAVMDAMAQPGTIQPIAVKLHPPSPLLATTAAVVLTVCDHDTPVWLDASLHQAGGVGPWLGFHTGAPLAASEAQAMFVLAADPAGVPAFARLAAGTQEYPDRSATLILQVEAFEGGVELLLEGPGIEAPTRFAPKGLPADFLVEWRQNGTLFPRGVDVILVAERGAVCLPRTTRISQTEA